MGISTVSTWFKAAPWYYLLAIAAGAAILIALIIAIIVVSVKRRNRARAPAVVTRELQNVVTIPTFPAPTTTAVPLASQANDAYTSDAGYFNAQGQFVQSTTTTKVQSTQTPVLSSKKQKQKLRPHPLAQSHLVHPAPSAPALSQEEDSYSDIPLDEEHTTTNVVRSSWIGLDGSARTLPVPTTAANAAHLARASVKPMQIKMKKRIRQSLQQAEAEEVERQLNEQVSDGASDNELDSSDSESDGEGAEIRRPVMKRPQEPLVFGPYTPAHNRAAIKIQKCYRSYINKVEAEVAVMMKEMGKMMSLPPKAATVCA